METRLFAAISEFKPLFEISRIGTYGINSPDESIGLTPLKLAAREGREAVAMHLLQSGAVIDKIQDAKFEHEDPWTETQAVKSELYTAMERGHVNLVQTFVFFGADQTEVRLLSKELKQPEVALNLNKLLADQGMFFGFFVRFITDTKNIGFQKYYSAVWNNFLNICSKDEVQAMQGLYALAMKYNKTFFIDQIATEIFQRKQKLEQDEQKPIELDATDFQKIYHAFKKNELASEKVLENYYDLVVYAYKIKDFVTLDKLTCYRVNQYDILLEFIRIDELELVSFWMQVKNITPLKVALEIAKDDELNDDIKQELINKLFISMLTKEGVVHSIISRLLIRENSKHKGYVKLFNLIDVDRHLLIKVLERCIQDRYHFSLQAELIPDSNQIKINNPLSPAKHALVSHLFHLFGMKVLPSMSVSEEQELKKFEQRLQAIQECNRIITSGINGKSYCARRFANWRWSDTIFASSTLALASIVTAYFLKFQPDADRAYAALGSCVCPATTSYPECSDPCSQYSQAESKVGMSIAYGIVPTSVISFLSCIFGCSRYLSYGDYGDARFNAVPPGKISPEAKTSTARVMELFQEERNNPLRLCNVDTTGIGEFKEKFSLLETRTVKQYKEWCSSPDIYVSIAALTDRIRDGTLGFEFKYETKQSQDQILINPNGTVRMIANIRT